MRKQRFFGALAIGAAILACAEMSARRFLPCVPGCVETARNPYRFRGWPEFVGANSVPPGTGRVVLLTNSQGYAGELPERKIYPCLLEGLLNQSPPAGFERWEVLNWSSDGITAAELSLLAAYLQDLRPQAVVAVTGYADYATGHDGQGFLYCRSDVTRLGTRWSVLRRMPGSFRRDHLKMEDTLTVFLRDRLALLRFREYAWSWLESRLPGVHGMFYAPRVNYLPWEVKTRRPWAKPIERTKPRAADPVFVYGAGSTRMLDGYLALLSRLPTRVLVVSEPVCGVAGDPRGKSNAVFQRDLRAAVERHGLRFWDMHDGLPADSFITTSHLHPANHRRFAERMAERLTGELGGSGGAGEGSDDPRRDERGAPSGAGQDDAV
jgi:hypothetical protein